jgi:glycosyltransferase involved in cell wall biosynthesis
VDATTRRFGAHDRSIGLVTETYEPEVNGVAMTLSRLVTGLCDIGHHIQIYRPGQSQSERQHCQGNISEILMPGMPIPGYSEMHFGLPAGRFFLKQWSCNRPDVLYVATEGPLGASAIKTADKLKIPVISGFHTNFHSYSRHYHLGWLAPLILSYLRQLHNKTQMTLVPTRELADKLQNQGFNNVEVLTRGVDTELFTPERRNRDLREQWGVGESTIVCIYVGRIAAEKNIQTAVETVLALSADYQVRFVLVGDGPLRRQLQRRYPDFIFCGTRTGADLAMHFASADVLLFPSRTETFGNVLTEAMASGLATVAYDEAAAHEHVTNWYNGVLAQGSPSDNFTTVTRRLCSQPELIQTIGQNASDYCRKLSWPHIVSRFETLLYSLCSETSPSVPREESTEGV